MSPLEHLGLVLIALLANGLSALAGGGAGLLQLPALIILGLPFPVALATHKIASVALGIGASLRHFKHSTFESQRLILILATGLPGVVLGAMLVLEIPPRAGEIALGLLTIGLGWYSWRRPQLGRQAVAVAGGAAHALTGALGLLVIGVLNGSLTSGTGLMVTLWLVRWYGLSYTQAVAYTLVLVGLFWNGAGALVLGTLGEVRWEWLPALLIGSLLGGYFGASMAHRYGNLLVKRTFEAVTILTGVALLLPWP
ncbi:MAG: sulfite exporter TauE/SafE family protein [Thioalkalivibrio sp.]|nr:sulfite exporter TauE/SafE family protein [Thioalkalivibrio sp.]